MIKNKFIIVFFFSCNSQEIKNEKKSNLKTIKDVSSLVNIFPFTNSNISKHKGAIRDSLGIPMLSYNEKLFYYPVQYTQIPLSYFANYIETQDESVKDEFLVMANFIKDNLKAYDGFSVWECNENIRGYKMSLPWSSSMAQGFGIGVMLQAYSLTDENSFLKAANSAVNAYKYNIKEHGVKSNWNGNDFYEEYADPNSHVLNGYIFSLAGLYYHYQYTNDEHSKSLFDNGIETLKLNINEYDADFTSFYGKLSYKEYQYASAINEDPDHYHELVIYQLLMLYHWTGEKIFYNYAHKFLQQDTGEVTDFYEKSKFNNINATHSIEPNNYGVENLNDELWSWGKYWSTNKFPTELVIEKDLEMKNISELVFYSISEESIPEDFEVYIFKSNKWELIFSSDNQSHTYLHKYNTGKYNTYIKGFSLKEKFNSKKIKIKFIKNSSNLVTLREVNVFFDRYNELDFIYESIEKKQ